MSDEAREYRMTSGCQIARWRWLMDSFNAGAVYRDALTTSATDHQPPPATVRLSGSTRPGRMIEGVFIP